MLGQIERNEVSPTVATLAGNCDGPQTFPFSVFIFRRRSSFLRPSIWQRSDGNHTVVSSQDPGALF